MKLWQRKPDRHTGQDWCYALLHVAGEGCEVQRWVHAIEDRGAKLVFSNTPWWVGREQIEDMLADVDPSRLPSNWLSVVHLLGKPVFPGQEADGETFEQIEL